jgi:opacity protein-like surface antigen
MERGVMVGRRVGPLLCAAALLGQLLAPPAAPAEWYTAGYGGISLEGMIRNVGLPNLGAARAQQAAAAYFTDPLFKDSPFNHVEQTMTSSDWNLKDSAMFGAKVGYFFNDYGYPWLGLELEAFTTQPKVKQQTIETNQTVVLTGPGGPVPGPGDLPTVRVNPSCGGALSCTETVQEAKLRVTTIAANVVLRRPGKFLEPYAGIGIGAFYFKGSGSLDGSQVVPGLNVLGGIKWRAGEHFSVFAEYKYNLATIEKLGSTYGLGGDYQITHVVGGIGWHF